MTDDEYYRLLKALGGKHFREYAIRVMSEPSEAEFIRREEEYRRHRLVERDLERVSEIAELFNKSLHGNENQELLHEVRYRLESPVLKTVHDTMDNVGMLDALDEGFPLLLREFRPSMLPREDREFLYRAGFPEDEIDVMLLLAREYGSRMSYKNIKPSGVFDDADEIVKSSIEIVIKNRPEDVAPKKKRKILTGIGKVLGGSVAGLGNVLLLTGSIAAPNPATAAGAIASGALAVTTIFGGLGDLRGE